MIINHNMNAMNAHRNMGMNTNAAGKSMEKLSSGLRINRAGDDAAGLAISEKMRGQIRGLDTASRNAQDGISLIQTAEGALNETENILQRMRELSVQGANDTNTDGDRAQIQKELDQLTEEIDRIATQTQFNEQDLLTGKFENSKLQIGANSGQKVEVSIGDMGSASLLGSTEGKAVTHEKIQLNDDGTINGNQTLKIKVGESELEISLEDGFDSDAVVAAVTDALDEAIATDSGHALEGFKQGADFAVTMDASGAIVVSGITDSADVAVNSVSEGVTMVPGNTLELKTNGDLKADTTLKLAFGETEIKVNLTANTSKEDMIKQIEDQINKTEGFNYAKVEIDDTTGELTIIADTTAADGTVTADSRIDVTSVGLKEKAVSVSDHESATASIKTIDTAIEQVSSQRANLGAMQNRLEHTINNLGTSSENLQAAESRIRDVDMAKEMLNFSKNNILNQAAQSMLAQAKSQPEGVLQLLR